MFAASGMQAVSASRVILPTDPMIGDGTEPQALSKDEIDQNIRKQPMS